MGLTLVKKALGTPGVKLVGGSERLGNKLEGQEIGHLIQVPTPGIHITTDPEKLFLLADAVIDFTTPDYTKILAEFAAKHKKILICGTTGLKAQGLAGLK